MLKNARKIQFIKDNRRLCRTAFDYPKWFQGIHMTSRGKVVILRARKQLKYSDMTNGVDIFYGLWRTWKAWFINRRQIKGEGMLITDFAVCVSRKEGKKKQVDIAQIKEILKVVNKLLDGRLYKEIRNRVTVH